jgi:hypothetical protein
MLKEIFFIKDFPRIKMTPKRVEPTPNSSEEILKI